MRKLINFLTVVCTILGENDNTRGSLIHPFIHSFVQCIFI